MSSGEISFHQVGDLSFPGFCEKTVSLGSWVIKDEVELLRTSVYPEELFIAGFGGRNHLHDREVDVLGHCNFE